MPKRAPSNSAQSSVAAMINAAKPLPQPPSFVRLTPDHMKFWPAIVRARARDEWADVDLIAAAQLARCMHEIEVEAEALRVEGSVIENARGTQIMNPRHSVLEQLSRRQLALMRSMKIAGATVGPAKEDLLKMRRAERDAEAVREELEEDLLAK